MKFMPGDRFIKVKGSHQGQSGTVVRYISTHDGILVIRYDSGREDATFESLCELEDKDCINID